MTYLFIEVKSIQRLSFLFSKPGTCLADRKAECVYSVVFQICLVSEEAACSQQDHVLLIFVSVIDLEGLTSCLS